MHFSKDKPTFFAFGIFLAYLSPWLLLGQNSYVLIHDHLDSNLVWFTTLIESATVFATSDTTLPMFMNAPRLSFGSEFNIQLVYYALFDPYVAYVINQIVLRIVAFIGMYLLLNKNIFQNKDRHECLYLALGFSLLPFWPPGGLSIAGLPLLTHVLLSIKRKEAKLYDYTILLIFPFYSSFVISMIFYLFILGIYWIYELVKGKFNIRYTISIFTLTLLYSLVNYRLFEAFLFSSNFVSHRVERIDQFQSFSASLRTAFTHFLEGQYHTHSLHISFLPLVFFVLIHSIYYKKNASFIKRLFLLNISISLWYGFWRYEGWRVLKENISILDTLNLSRFHALVPLSWYVLFALSVHYLLEQTQIPKKKNILWIFIALNIFILFIKSDFVQVMKTEQVSFKQFYAQDLFLEVEREINLPKNSYKVVSVGIHPAIARYNGFYTADGYLANYGLAYKKNFRKIIELELQKDEKLRKYFDHWGNRCYLFSSEIGYQSFARKKQNISKNIDLNVSALRDLGVQFLFSAYELTNLEKNSLKLRNIFSNENSAWQIYLYEVMG